MPQSALPPTAPEIQYRSILAMICEHADRSPDQDCLISIGQGISLTWRQLYRLTNKLSAWLHAHAIGPNDRILVLTDNSLENLILYYGIQRHGATFCTVNVDINANHMQEIIGEGHPTYGHQCYSKALARAAGYPVGDVRAPGEGRVSGEGDAHDDGVVGEDVVEHDLLGRGPSGGQLTEPQFADARFERGRGGDAGDGQEQQGEKRGT